MNEQHPDGSSPPQPGSSPPIPRRKALAQHLGIAASFAVIAVGMTWPLAVNLNTHVIDAKWFYDSMVNMMVLGSRTHSLLGISELGIYENYFCYPLYDTIVYNESHLGLVWLYLPFYAITHDPLLSYNLLLLLSLVMSCYFTFLFVRDLTGSPWAAYIAGVAFAFCPYVFFEMGRIQLVATQWIPLCMWSLHRAVLTGRWPWIALLAGSFVMQLGSCMYYAMFLVLILPVVALWLVIQQRRFDLRFWLRLGLAGAVAAVVALLMVRPYLESRQKVSLTRSEAKVRSYSGKVEHLASVYPENKTLTFLHNRAKGGAEPIAFPGFTVLGFSALAVLIPLIAAWRRREPGDRRRVLALLLMWPPLLVGGYLASMQTLSFLTMFLMIVALTIAWLVVRKVAVFGHHTPIYLSTLVLALLLFFGPVVTKVGDAKVFGLYYYFYTYVPTFDSIRYVSRLAVMVQISLAVLAGFGLASLFRALPNTLARASGFAVVLLLLLAELLNAPVTLAQIPSKRHLPSVYNWLQKHKGPEPIAILPAYPKGFYGARNDYLTLFHQRRTINGKSSWMPPVTYLWINESKKFPQASAARHLQTLGAKYLVVHGGEMKRHQRQRSQTYLEKYPETFVPRYRDKLDVIYEIKSEGAVGVGLLETPPLPAGSVEIAPASVDMFASRRGRDLKLAVDGDPDTRWATNRSQQEGDWLEFKLKRPEPVNAIEFSHFSEAFDAPASFRLLTGMGDGEMRTIMERPKTRMFVDQVYQPKHFTFRVVIDKPVPIDRLRIEIMEPINGRWWSVHEAKLWSAPK